MQPRTSNLEPRARFCSGFTLIEIVVVITIISMLALLVLPRLPSSDAANLKSSARSLAAAIRYLGDRSVTAKVFYRLHLNLTDGTITVSTKGADGTDVPPDDTFLGRSFLTGGITIEDVEVPRLGKVSSGEVIVDFGRGGLEEFLTVHLQGARDHHLTVAAFPQNGKVKILDGYQETLL